MEDRSFGCGNMMGAANQALCAPLHQLKEEHIPLRKSMEEFYLLAKRLEQLEAGDPKPLLMELHAKITEFKEALEPHSEREEEGLFPMLAAYIGRESGPIAVMEYEHEQAKKHMARFLDEIERTSGNMEIDGARQITIYVIQAYLILTDHFLKEENVLFPMAERVLTAEDKEWLCKMYQNM